MASQIVVIVYFVIGCGAAIAVFAQKTATGPIHGVSGAFLMLVLWPFLLPSAVLREPTIRPPTPRSKDDEGIRRIERVSHSIRKAWEHSDAGATREREITEGFLEKLRGQQYRLQELTSALPGAASSIRSKLEKLHENTASEIDTGLSLLEEMVAQLTLLRFTGLTDSVTDGVSAERDGVEDLLARIEAMADMGHEEAEGASG